MIKLAMTTSITHRLLSLNTTHLWPELFSAKCSHFHQTGAYQTKASANMTHCSWSLYYQPEQCAINGKSHIITIHLHHLIPPKHIVFMISALLFWNRRYWSNDVVASRRLILPNLDSCKKRTILCSLLWGGTQTKHAKENKHQNLYQIKTNKKMGTSTPNNNKKGKEEKKTQKNWPETTPKFILMHVVYLGKKQKITNNKSKQLNWVSNSTNIIILPPKISGHTELSGVPPPPQRCCSPLWRNRFWDRSWLARKMHTT